MYKRRFLSLLAAATFVLTSGPAGRADHHSKDIVEVAASSESFSTLVVAIKAADLVDTLKGKVPLTVFAPTNEAFAKLPEGVLQDLLKPENKQKLQSVLTYHVIGAKVPAASVVKMSSAKTLNGQEIKISVNDGKVRVNEATVVKTDIMASNGVIHVIDAVILPKGD